MYEDFDDKLLLHGILEEKTINESEMIYIDEELVAVWTQLFHHVVSNKLRW